MRKLQILGFLGLVSICAPALGDVPLLLYYHPAEGSNDAIDTMVAEFEEGQIATVHVVDDYETSVEYVNGEPWDVVIVSDQVIDPYDVTDYLTEDRSIWILTTQANDDIRSDELTVSLELDFFGIGPPMAALDCYEEWVRCVAFCMTWPFPPDPVECSRTCADNLRTCLTL